MSFAVAGTTITLTKGDTGSVKIRANKLVDEEGEEVEPFPFNPQDRCVFTIKNAVGAEIRRIQAELDEEGAFVVQFTNSDTENLPAGNYPWDVRYVINPYYDESGRIVNGDQVITPRDPMTMTLKNPVGEV